jgi:hypothetical protein
MAHFAKIGLDNIVVNIIVIDNNDLLDENKNESEDLGRKKAEDLTGHETWVQCSYNANFRGHYPSIGDRYDSELDIFKQSSAPFSSWILNTSSGYFESPIPYPDDGKQYIWDEPTLQWVEIG